MFTQAVWPLCQICWECSQTAGQLINTSTREVSWKSRCANLREKPWMESVISPPGRVAYSKIEIRTSKAESAHSPQRQHFNSLCFELKALAWLGLVNNMDCLCCTNYIQLDDFWKMLSKIFSEMALVRRVRGRRRERTSWVLNLDLLSEDLKTGISLMWRCNC